MNMLALVPGLSVCRVCQCAIIFPCPISLPPTFLFRQHFSCPAASSLWRWRWSPSPLLFFPGFCLSPFAFRSFALSGVLYVKPSLRYEKGVSFHSKSDACKLSATLLEALREESWHLLQIWNPILADRLRSEWILF